MCVFLLPQAAVFPVLLVATGVVGVAGTPGVAWQDVAAVSLTTLAVAHVAWRGWKAFFAVPGTGGGCGSASACGSGCSNASGCASSTGSFLGKEQAASRSSTVLADGAVFVSLEQLTAAPRGETRL